MGCSGFDAARDHWTARIGEVGRDKGDLGEASRPPLKALPPRLALP